MARDDFSSSVFFSFAPFTAANIFKLNSHHETRIQSVEYILNVFKILKS